MIVFLVKKRPRRNKLKLVEGNLNELEKRSSYLSNIWRSNKSSIDLQQRKKIELENIRNELIIAKRDGNLEKAGELSYHIIPNLLNELKSIENNEEIEDKENEEKAKKEEEEKAKEIEKSKKKGRPKKVAKAMQLADDVKLFDSNHADIKKIAFEKALRKITVA